MYSNFLAMDPLLILFFLPCEKQMQIVQPDFSILSQN